MSRYLPDGCKDSDTEPCTVYYCEQCGSDNTEVTKDTKYELEFKCNDCDNVHYASANLEF